MKAYFNLLVATGTLNRTIAISKTKSTGQLKLIRTEKFGSKRHVVDSLLNLSQHFAPGYFDLIVYNGVFGHGIDIAVLNDL